MAVSFGVAAVVVTAVSVISASILESNFKISNHIYELKAQSALSAYDCKAPLKDQTFSFSAPANFLHLTKEIQHHVAIVNAERLDISTPTSAKDTLNEFPVRITGKTGDGSIVTSDVRWNKTRCPRFER